MSKSAQLRMRDIRQAYRLIGDCRDLGADPVLAEPPVPVSGFSVGLDARGIERLMAYTRQNGLAEDPVFQALRHIPGALVVRTRGQVLSDAEWQRSRTYNEYLRPRSLGWRGVRRETTSRLWRA